MLRAPVTCILPPYILQSIAQNGRTAQQRARALAALAAAERLRGRREALANILPALAPPPSAPVAPRLHRDVHTAENGTDLPGRLVRTEGQAPSGDPAVDEAYDGAGATFDLYLKAYERNSIDDRGMTLLSTVHYDQAYNNAFWDGSQMVYGDGDGELFHRFTIALDVIGHELTHGLTEHEANLVYLGQPGALNEHMSDVFGILVKQFQLGQRADQSDWVIGAGLFTDAVQGEGIRSLKAPGTAYDDDVLGKDPQPAHMKDYVLAPVQYQFADYGGVHINSGIPNHAFYLAAIAMGGYAWEKAGLIWYVALRDRLRRLSDFQHCAVETRKVAGELFGEGGREQRAVQGAWAQVGISTEAGLLPRAAARPMPGLVRR